MRRAPHAPAIVIEQYSAPASTPAHIIEAEFPDVSISIRLVNIVKGTTTTSQIGTGNAATRPQTNVDRRPEPLLGIAARPAEAAFRTMNAR